jgi:acyl-CoA synthetase (AMP-forming)/AMP-acid ligase II
VSAPLTLAAVLSRAAGTRPGTLAIHVDGEPPLTYAELLEQAQRVAAALRVRHPDARHVGLLLPNSSRWLAALYGAAIAGRTAVLLNPRLTVEELLYQIGQSDTEVLVCGPHPRADPAPLLERLAADLPTLEVVWSDDDAPGGTAPWSEWLDVAPPPAPAARVPLETDTAVIIYTSGTTALPKGVMLAHRSIVRNAWLVGRRFRLGPGDSIFSAGPFFHSGGLTLHLLLAAVYGLPALSVPAFDPDHVLDMVERSGATVYNGIETLFLRLTDSPRFDRRRLQCVRTGWATGSPSILHAIAEQVGVPGVVGCYGISEASPNVSMSPCEDTPEHRLETVGRPQPWTSVRIWDVDRAQPLPAGQIGEITVRGYGLMQGYYNKPEETADALRNGWLHTGDLGLVRPDGYLEFHGRAKDIVRAGGENISCAEVENAIYGLGGVELAALVGVEDERYGELPVAVVKPAAGGVGGSNLTAEEVIERLRERLAGYKVPRHVLFMDEMPLTESGKVRKGPLAESIRPSLETLNRR